MSIYIFHRSLRLHDNLPLIKSLSNGLTIPIFIFTPEQVGSIEMNGKGNPFFSEKGFNFMINCLLELAEKIKSYGGKLYFFYGKQHKILNQLIKNLNKKNIPLTITDLYIAREYTKYGVDREENLIATCKKLNINCNIIEDYLLYPIDTIKNINKDKIYKKFTPYYNKFKNYTITQPPPQPIKFTKKLGKHFLKLKSISDISNITITYLKEINYNYKQYYENIYSIVKKLLKNVSNHTNYEIDRNILSKSTTRLSKYIKFGIVSIRSVYSVYKINPDLIKQLFWREFYHTISYNNLYVFEGKSFNQKYDKIKWMDKNFDLWKNGMTGFPIVDAGMRELNTTGYMHNRARLITSNFLVKQLGIDWRKGEQYFAQKLIDYDPSVNNGNWQWSAGCGVDSQPYFRIFSPWRQSLKHDKDCLYIKKWVVELKDQPNHIIHTWNDNHNTETIYPPPCTIINKEKILQMYKKIYV